MKIYKCARCKREFLKTDRSYNILPDGALGDPDICTGCNAAKWIVGRFKEGKSISMEECRKLPRTLIFDPEGRDTEEEDAGREFQKIIDSFIEEAGYKSNGKHYLY